MTLRDLNARIRALEDAEQLRQNTEAALLRKRMARGLGFLGSWARRGSEQAGPEAAARQLGAHRESVIWFLRTRLQEATRTQQRMMETRLTREMEKNRSVLAKARSPAMAKGAAHQAAHVANGRLSAGTAGLPVEEEEKRKQPAVDDLTEDQRQMFEKGNQDMLRHLESTLDKVRHVGNTHSLPLGHRVLRSLTRDAGPPRTPSSRLPSCRTCSSATSPRSRLTLTSWLPTRSRRQKASARATGS